mmetsp:Transcript_36484/g.96113  ORF Transcript_36484/g.96113 Transcript_36484/m.96113 type:complete len:262 (-) Transcript_36484:3-788(-)
MPRWPCGGVEGAVDGEVGIRFSTVLAICTSHSPSATIILGTKVTPPWPMCSVSHDLLSLPGITDCAISNGERRPSRPARDRVAREGGCTIVLATLKAGPASLVCRDEDVAAARPMARFESSAGFRASSPVAGYEPPACGTGVPGLHSSGSCAMGELAAPGASLHCEASCQFSPQPTTGPSGSGSPPGGGGSVCVPGQAPRPSAREAVPPMLTTLGLAVSDSADMRHSTSPMVRTARTSWLAMPATASYSDFLIHGVKARMA